VGRHGITLDDVKSAIQKLQVAGKHPTIDAIRQTIGSGSKSTITRHLHDIKLQITSEDHATASEQTVPPDVLNLVTALWEKLQSTSPGTDVDKKDAIKDSLTEKYITLQRTHDLITRQLQVRSRVCNQLEQKLTVQQQLLTSCEQELRQKNSYNQELARRVQILASDLQQARISIQHLQKQIGSLENTKRALMLEKQSLEEKARQQ